MLEIWGRADSSNVQAVMWCVGELDLPHKRYDVGHRFGGNDTPEFRAMNPNGTVPVLKDGGGPPIWEAGAILRYLAGRYAAPPFWPEEGPDRARVDTWAEWAKVTVSLAFTGPIFWQVVRTAARDRDEKAVAAGLKRLGALFDIAERQFEQHDYLAGAAFTLADIQFGHILYRYYTMAIERTEHPRLGRYYAALTERPAYREHVMVSYDALRAS